MPYNKIAGFHYILELPCVAWNFPAVNVMRKVAGALAAGCSITIKPSEETPATAIAIGRALTDAGLPAGVLNIVLECHQKCQNIYCHQLYPAN